MKTYADKWTCPQGHENTTIRRVTSAGKMVGTTCLHRACNWTKYKVLAGSVPAVKP